MARIVGHLPVAELEARYRAARGATEARHLQAIWLLAQGRPFNNKSSAAARPMSKPPISPLTGVKFSIVFSFA